MLVGKSTFVESLQKLKIVDVLTLDTETTGLQPYKGDRLFSIIISNGVEVFYYNFQPYPTMDDAALDEFVLDESHMEMMQAELFDDTTKTWQLHNAKYDMHMMAQDNLYMHGFVYCTMIGARLCKNDLMRYSLDSLVKRYLPGDSKSDVVADYIKEHELFDKIKDPWTEKFIERHKYHLVPFDLIIPYAEQDVIITRKLASWQTAHIRECDARRPVNSPALMGMVKLEMNLLKVVFAMERRGIRIDIDYCTKAREHYLKCCAWTLGRIEELTGEKDFKDSGKHLNTLFAKLGVSLAEKNTVKINPNLKTWETDAEALAKLAADTSNPKASELAALILDYRDASKNAHTYFSNFLSMADEFGMIHASFNQSGTTTGRFSCSEPNLQNLTKEEDEEDDKPPELFPVRRAFIPRDGYCFFAPDYSQMEYRMMLDYAGQHDVIQEVISGVDVHQATANLTGLTRSQAKTFNFAFLYGSGNAKLALQLKKSEAEAMAIRNTFNDNLPAVTRLLSNVKATASSRGYITNWRGRRSYCELPKFSYKMPNHLIQGACADVVKEAMIAVHNILQGHKSGIVSQIHDELAIELHETELHLAPAICAALESAYTPISLPMAVDPSFSWESLSKKQKGFPSERR